MTVGGEGVDAPGQIWAHNACLKSNLGTVAGCSDINTVVPATKFLSYGKLNSSLHAYCLAIRV